MKNTVIRSLSILFLLLLGGSPIWAADLEAQEEIEALKKRLETLESKLEQPQEASPLAFLENKISFGALLEVEAMVEKAEGGEEASDLTLATVELSSEVQWSDTIGGHILLLWEEDDTESIEVDEAVITLSCLLRCVSRRWRSLRGVLYQRFGRK